MITRRSRSTTSSSWPSTATTPAACSGRPRTGSYRREIRTATAPVAQATTCPRSRTRSSNGTWGRSAWPGSRAARSTAASFSLPRPPGPARAPRRRPHPPRRRPLTRTAPPRRARCQPPRPSAEALPLAILDRVLPRAPGPAAPVEEERMSVIEHLEALRRVLIVIIAAWAVTTIAAFFVSGQVVEWLVSRAGLGHAIYLGPGSFVLTRLQTAPYIGLILAETDQ